MASVWWQTESAIIGDGHAIIRALEVRGSIGPRFSEFRSNIVLPRYSRRMHIFDSSHTWQEVSEGTIEFLITGWEGRGSGHPTDRMDFHFLLF